MNAVAIYRSTYLPLSETFISNHLRSLTRYRPIPLCDVEHDAAHKLSLRPMLTPRHLLEKAAFRRLGFAPRLFWTLKAQGVTLLHCHFLTDAALVLPFARHYRIPMVVTAHGYDATTSDCALAASWLGRRYLELRRQLADYVSAIVCVSDFIKCEVIKQGYPEAKLRTIFLGVDTEALINPLQPENRRGVVFVGRLVEKKGTRFLLDAYHLLPEPIRQAQPLFIIGDGPVREALQDQATVLGIDVNFLGACDHNTALQLIQKARVFCFPSTRSPSGDAEGMGIVLMEALASGTPVVIFDRQPMAPLLKGENSGVLAKDRDSVSLAAALESILCDEEETKRLVNAGPAFCRKHFALRKNTATLEKLYDQFAKPLS